MEKKIYERPVMQVEAFVANHYCSDCGDGPTTVTYKFQCNAGSHSNWQDVYLETNGRAGLQTNGNPWTGVQADRYIGEYHACNKTHNVTLSADEPFDIDATFPKGYVIADWGSGWQHEYETLEVRIWRGNDGRNIHCTTQVEEDKFTPHYNFS